jgi:hypothetical protein
MRANENQVRRHMVDAACFSHVKTCYARRKENIDGRLLTEISAIHIIYSNDDDLL